MSLTGLFLYSESRLDYRNWFNTYRAIDAAGTSTLIEPGFGKSIPRISALTIVHRPAGIKQHFALQDNSGCAVLTMGVTVVP